ncbi:hypothetical protein MMC27_000337 [Xylographa pallens]|nr:hypothetical protein [Xylographa pallens]
MASPVSRLSVPDDAAVFRQARDEFLNELSDEEKLSYAKVSTPVELLEDIQKFEQFADNRPRLMKVLQALASNFVGFFDQLGEQLVRISLVIPAYSEILQFDVTSVSDRFRYSLRKFYVDLFEFFKSVARVFTRKNGKKLVEHIRLWIEPPSFADTYERSLAARQADTAHWLFVEDSFKRWRDTAHDTNTTADWNDAFWVQGNPGTGKTILAASSVQELRCSKNILSQPSPYVFYFFFEAETSGKCTRDDAIRALLAQLLQQCRTDDTVLNIFAYFMSEHRAGQPNISWREMIDLLVALAENLSKIYFVLDGIDECNEPDDLLLDLWKLRNTKNIQLLLFSRPTVTFLRNFVPRSQWLILTRESIAADLKIYFNEQFQALQQLSLLPDQIDADFCKTCLLSGADGMFLWASLMMAYLRSPSLSPFKRLSTILRLKTPEKMEDMYSRILQHLCSNLRHEQVLARTVFLLLIFALSPLHDRQLEDVLLTIDEDEAPYQKNQYGNNVLRDFKHSIVLVCGSLVEFRWSDHLQRSYCSFIHHSVLEYFRARCSARGDRCAIKHGTIQYFSPPTFEAQTELAMLCLSYIMFRAPVQPLSGIISQKASPSQIDNLFPFLGYASLSWPSYLIGMLAKPKRLSDNCFEHFSQDLQALLRLLSQFLASRLVPMSWVETLYTFVPSSDRSLLPDIYQKLSDWARWLSTLGTDYVSIGLEDVASRVNTLSHDLSIMNEKWAETLSRNPNQIWNDVPAFTTSEFFQQSSAVSLKVVGNLGHNRPGSNTTPLSRISQTNLQTGIRAILTIWPSRHFKLEGFDYKFIWNKKNNDRSFSGWLAQYELWDVNLETFENIAEWWFSLKEDEIILQLKHFIKKVYLSRSETMTGRVTQKLAVHFPTSIGDRLDTFTVLRTVFIRKSVGSSVQPESYDKVNLWLEAPIPVVYTANSTFVYPSLPLLRPDGDSDDDQMPYTSSLELDRRTIFRLSMSNEYLIYQCVRRSSVIEDLDREDWASEVEPIDQEHTGSSADDQNSDWQDENWVPDCEQIASSLAIFSTAQARIGGNIRLPGYISRGENEDFLSRFAFHTTLPLMVLHCGSDSAFTGKVILWNFKHGTDSGSENVVGLDWATINGNSNLCFETLLTDAAPWVERLQFSPCGKQVVVEYYASDHPIVIGIEETQVYKLAFEAAKKSTQLYFHANSTQRDIELIQRDGETQTVQPLLSLPIYSDTRHLRISLLSSQERNDNKLRVMLDKSAKLYYTIIESGEDVPVAVVEKDLTALLGARKQKFGREWKALPPTSAIDAESGILEGGG